MAYLRTIVDAESIESRRVYTGYVAPGDCIADRSARFAHVPLWGLDCLYVRIGLRVRDTAYWTTAEGFVWRRDGVYGLIQEDRRQDICFTELLRSLVNQCVQVIVEIYRDRPLRSPLWEEADRRPLVRRERIGTLPTLCTA